MFVHHCISGSLALCISIRGCHRMIHHCFSGWLSLCVCAVCAGYVRAIFIKESDVRTIWPLSLSTFHMARVFSAYPIIRHGSVFVSTVFLLPLFVVPSFLVIKYPFVPGARRLETSGLYPCQAS